MNSIIGRYVLKQDHVFAIKGSDMHLVCGSIVKVLDSTEDSVYINFVWFPCRGYAEWYSKDILDILERVSD